MDAALPDADSDDSAGAPACDYPAHVTARRAERRWMARTCFGLFIVKGSIIASIAAFDEAVAHNVATIWPLLATIFGTEAIIVCAYFGAGASENNKVENLIALAGRLA